MCMKTSNRIKKRSRVIFTEYMLSKYPDKQERHRNMGELLKEFKVFLKQQRSIRTFKKYS